MAKALNLLFTHYTIPIPISISGAGHHPLGESSATSLTTLDAGFSSDLGCVARAVDCGKRFVTEKLTELAERRAALEWGVAELDQQLAKVQDKAVTAEVVRAALSQVQQVYACLKPYEQRELVRLVLHRAEVHVKELGFRD